MNEKQFTKHLKSIQELNKISNDIEKSLRLLDDDISFHLGKAIMLPYNILRDAMDDKEDWLGYFLWEMKMNGEFSKKSIGNHANGDKIYIRNYKDLYNLIKYEDR